jgi:nondiscriminating aspartyl-tRNA synthetase
MGYPMAKRPCYAHPDPERTGLSNAYDLLFRWLAMVIGGQRMHRHEVYVVTLAARGMETAPFAGYLEAFRHGMPPQGRFAIGLERMVARLIAAENVRETTLFPRDLHHLPRDARASSYALFVPIHQSRTRDPCFPVAEDAIVS